MIDLSLLSPLTPPTRHIGAAEYLEAKLAYEAAPYALHDLLLKTPGKIYLVDVRDPESYGKGHIRGAVNIPAEKLRGRLNRLPRDRAVVTYSWDATCTLAPRAALELAREGFEVQFLAGGIEAWRRQGYPVEKLETAF